MFFISDLPPSPPAAETIVVTAARSPEATSDVPASVTLISPERIERLGEPLLADLLRLTPSASLATAGPAGSQIQLRLRGAEANHTLLFIDGIRANDPAAGNEPRFELLSAELGDRIEVVRGPQSALWGSEAVGGVVAIHAAPVTGVSVLGEGGGSQFGRLGGTAGVVRGGLSIGLAAGVQGARGIDALTSGPAERDGYRNATVRGKLAWQSGPVTLSASGFGIAARSQFDGYDPDTFRRADTDEESRNRLAAGRIGARFADEAWSAGLSASRLSSRNRNLLASAEQNRTSGGRDTAVLDVARRFVLGGVTQRLTVAAEASRERFSANDSIYGGFTNQDRRRDQQALTGEWRGEAGPVLVTFALRRDRFSDFADATTARAGALLRLGDGWQIAANWGEGIAQPSFFDLYGFFPGSFAGNADLKPELSRGGELSFRRVEGRLRGALTFYRQRLRSEIVEEYTGFIPTVINAPGVSTRGGIEIEAGWRAGEWLDIGVTYAFLAAEEPAGRELRRARHSGALVASGVAKRIGYGVSLAYAGARLDRDFDQFPAPLVKLDKYWSAGARLAWRATDRFEIFGRVANAFNERTDDVVGYAREGRTAYAGIRARLGR